MSIQVAIQETPIAITVSDIQTTTVQLESVAGVSVELNKVWRTDLLFGTGSPPSPLGLADGTMFFRYE